MSPLKSAHARAQVIHESDQSAEALYKFRYGWIDAHAAMSYLSVESQSALYRLIHQHRLPCGRAGRHYRFRRADLDQWVASSGRSALAAVRG